MGKKEKENNRFEIISEEVINMATGNRILKDKETGVLYLFHYSGYAGGLTLMTDNDGKPLTDTTVCEN